MLIPNAAHGYGAASQYMTRRRWDYFVRYLAGGIPPYEYEMKPWAAVMNVRSNGPSPDNAATNDLAGEDAASPEGVNP